MFTKSAPNLGLTSNYTGTLLTDVNFDGAADLVLATWPGAPSDPFSEVLLGNGDGTFAPKRALPAIPAAYNTFIKLAVADLNRDGNPDILVSGSCPNNTCGNVDPNRAAVLIWPGTSDGWFGPALPDTTVPAPTIADAIFPVRINDDCIPDLALNVHGATSRFYSNNGSFGFSPILANAPGSDLLVPIPSGDGADFGFFSDNPTAFSVIRQVAKPSCPITPVAAVLPSSRSVSIGQPITLFATMLNPGAVIAKNCKVGFNSPVAATFSYQTTNPATNAPTGTPNTPVDIAANGFQTFLLSFTASEAMSAREMRFGFICDNALDAAPAVRGVNTATLAVSATPVADVITVAATVSNDGIARVPSASGTGFFSVAGVNIGASASLTVAPIVSGGAQVIATVCETNPATAACLALPAASVIATFAPNVSHTFSVFLAGQGALIASDFARKRVRLEFKEGATGLRGATGVAVCTAGAPGC